MFDFKSLISAILGNSKNEGVYDLKSATVMMKELPESDILQAQIEIIKALQQINSNPRTNIKERFKTIPYLDEKARSLQDHLVAIYQGNALDDGATPKQVLPTLLAFWNDMGDGYRLCIKQATQNAPRGLDKELQLFTLRGLMYFSEQARWAYLRYMEMDSRTWRNLNRLYLFAEQKGFATQPLQPYPNAEITDIRREFMQLLMLSLAIPEKLQPAQIDLVTQWLKRWASRVDLESQIKPNRQLFAINIAGSTPPKRLRRDMVGENWRYWFTETLTLHIKETIEKLQQGEDPVELGLPAESNQAANIDLMQHLINLWSRDTPAPVRKAERHSTQKTIKVTCGLDDVIGHLRGDTATDTHSRWSIDNESTTGIGVNYQTTRDDELQVGEIIGLDGVGMNPVSVGIVRRITKKRDGQVNVGIETISQTPIIVELTPLLGNRSFFGVYSPENTSINQSRFLVLPQAFFADNREFRLAAQGKSYRIRLSPAIEHTANASLANFAVLEKL
ncbi:hypothetical protein K4H28_01975 [Deefgea tanakiae]|jgi:hypothetical protein|uniref:Zorya protein ZorC EH domain-containing protein n=1 Tax=Deefgea tanakiae TaxID=2865840 RepID=A0ABX8Z6L7_9NEIS|nr:hypothetical protein [Deefgea tanakiae]QZA78213.1 hypothetical protein K4H28_01975 [Deefgea tanakiae]